MIGKVLYLLRSLYSRIEKFAKDRSVWYDFDECKDLKIVYTGIDKVLNLHFALYMSSDNSRILVITLKDLVSDSGLTTDADFVNQVPFLYQILKYCCKGNGGNCFMDYLIENIIKHASFSRTAFSMVSLEELGLEKIDEEDVLSYRDSISWRDNEASFFYDPDKIKLRILIKK